MSSNNLFFQDGKKFYCSLDERQPVLPYKVEKVINDKFAYIIDNNGIIWIKSQVMFFPDEDYGICYTDGCLRECVTYIIATGGYNAYLNIKKYISEHLNSYKENCYDATLKKYDKSFVK